MSSATSVCPSVRPESRAPVERCTFWRSVYCGSAQSHHQQAALQPQQPRSIEYAWRNVGEMTSPFYSIPSAGLSVPTTLAISCSARYSLPRYFTRTGRVPWDDSISAKSACPLRLNIFATLLVSLEVSWSWEVRLMGFTRCSVKTRLEAGNGGFCTRSLEADPVGQLHHLESHDQPTNCSPPLPTDPQSRTFRTFACLWEALIKNHSCPYALSRSTMNEFSWNLTGGLHQNLSKHSTFGLILKKKWGDAFHDFCACLETYMSLNVYRRRRRFKQKLRGYISYPIYSRHS